MKEKIINDFFYSFLDIGLISAIGYIFYIVMGKMLTISEYGILMTIIGLYTILSSLTSLGFQEAIIRFIPFLKKTEIKSYLRFILEKSLIVTAVVGIAFLLFSKFIATNIYSNEAMFRPLQMLSLLLITGTAALLTRGILVGLKMFKKIFLFDIISQPIRVLIPIIMVLFGFSIIGSLAGWIVSFFIFFSLSLFFLLKALPTGKTKNIDKNIYMYGISSALSASGIWILIQTNILILSVIDLKMAGLFGVALVFGEIMLMFPSILGIVILPYLSSFFADKSFSKAKRLIEISLKNILILSFPLFLFIYLFSNALIKYIYNLQYVGATIFMLPFTLGCLFQSLSMIQLMAIYVSGSPFTKIKMIWSGVFVNLFLSLLFYSLLGPVGIVYGFLLTQILIFISVSILSHKKIGITVPRKMLNVLFPLLIFSTIIFFVEKFYINFYMSLLFLFFSVIIYFVLLYYFKAFDKDDEKLLNIIFKRLGIHKDIYISR